VAVAVGQLMSYQWLKNRPGKRGNLAGVLFIVIILGVYAFLCNHPLPLPLFYTY
jgi:hypothetical protein